MQRNHALALLAVLALAAVAVLFLPRGASAPPPPEAGSLPAAAAQAQPAADPGAAAGKTAEKGARREELVVPGGDPNLDPEVRAALTGFKGRVVDHAREPVGGCGVRIYRAAMDAVLPLGGDLLDGEAKFEPRLVAGETTTAADGTFRIEGVWPRAFYVLFAGIGTDAPSHRLLAQTPAPGELLDLGDVVLDDAAVVTGRVVDERGEPVAGALVRAADVPGQVLGFLPLERFDPQGALLVRAPESPVQVLEMPAWVERVFEHLPIPSTSTAADGTFRLVGVVPGSNVVATTKAGLLADVKSAVVLKPGQVKDLGTIRLRAGEELAGRVVDTAGKPVAGAEVLAGSTLLMAPVDFARRLGATDADGRFAAEGFAPGKVTVAARRTKADPWVMAAPQPIHGEATVTLPAVLALTVQVTAPDGAVVAAPKLRLLPGRRGGETAVMAMLGLLPGIDLRGRLGRLEDGRWRIEGLPAGRYVLVAGSADDAIATADVDLTQADAQVAVQLPKRIDYSVRVLGPAGEPIRSAAVYVQERGEGRVRALPFCAGHTGSDGRLRIGQVGTTSMRVSAEHPRWGAVHGSMQAGDAELVLRMETPGWIEGALTDGGKAPAPGKYTVTAEYRPATRGATEQMPALATPAADGSFAFRALQPGSYRVGAISSLAALTSPGGVFALAQSAYFDNGANEQEVVVASGQGARVEIQAGEVAEAGPTGHVFGTAQVDGRLAGSYVVSAWTSRGRRRSVRVDASGRFDLGQVPAGHVQLSLIEGGDSMMFSRRGLWNTDFELKEAEEREVSIQVEVSGLQGTAYRPDGSPAAGLLVQAHGRPFAAKDGDGSGFWHSEQTDADGNFRFEKVPAGVYELRAGTRDDEPMRVRLGDVRAEPGAPATGLRLQLQAALTVAGRVDMTVFDGKPDWVYVSFFRVDPAAPDRRRDQVAGEGVREDGSFQTSELDPGTYEARVYASARQWHEYEVPGLIEVPPGGVRGLFLRPVLRQPQKGGGR